MNPPFHCGLLSGGIAARVVDPNARGRGRAFTLIEMVITIAVVLILLAIALPSVNTMWAQHRENDALNGISGMLMSTRAKAIQTERGEMGMFFYLDGRGVQQMALIARDPRIEQQPGEGDVVPNWRTQPAWQDVFTVAQDGGRALLAPMRAVPRYAVEEPETGQAYQRFSPVELGNEDFNNALALDNAQRHRNFFAIIFSEGGELDVQRNVIIRDPDLDGDDVGDVTGLSVRDTANKRYETDGATPPFELVTVWVEELPQERGPKVDAVVGLDRPDVVVSFPSIDGLLVYDDSLLQAADEGAKRDVLLEKAIPYYIHRLSGSVVRGPTGEVPLSSPAGP